MLLLFAVGTNCVTYVLDSIFKTEMKGIVYNANTLLYINQQQCIVLYIYLKGIQFPFEVKLVKINVFLMLLCLIEIISCEIENMALFRSFIKNINCDIAEYDSMTLFLSLIEIINCDIENMALFRSFTKKILILTLQNMALWHCFVLWQKTSIVTLQNMALYDTVSDRNNQLWHCKIWLYDTISFSDWNYQLWWYRIWLRDTVCFSDRNHQLRHCRIWLYMTLFRSLIEIISCDIENMALFRSLIKLINCDIAEYGSVALFLPLIEIISFDIIVEVLMNQRRGTVINE